MARAAAGRAQNPQVGDGHDEPRAAQLPVPPRDDATRRRHADALVLPRRPRGGAREHAALRGRTTGKVGARWLRHALVRYCIALLERYVSSSSGAVSSFAKLPFTCTETQEGR